MSHFVLIQDRGPGHHSAVGGFVGQFRRQRGHGRRAVSKRNRDVAIRRTTLGSAAGGCVIRVLAVVSDAVLETACSVVAVTRNCPLLEPLSEFWLLSG